MFEIGTSVDSPMTLITDDQEKGMLAWAGVKLCPVRNPNFRSNCDNYWKQTIILEQVCVVERCLFSRIRRLNWGAHVFQE